MARAQTNPDQLYEVIQTCVYATGGGERMLRLGELVRADDPAVERVPHALVPRDTPTAERRDPIAQVYDAPMGTDDDAPDPRWLKTDEPGLSWRLNGRRVGYVPPGL
jgi:hypothetical protein